MKFLLVLTLIVHGFSASEVKLGPYASAVVCEIVKGALMTREGADGSTVTGECREFENNSSTTGATVGGRQDMRSTPL